MLKHLSVLLNEVLEALPLKSSGKILDVTAGGGGHLGEILRQRADWRGQAWDQDPLAEARLREKFGEELKPGGRVEFRQKNFAVPPDSSERFDFILADLGISSFQVDDPERGLSLFSDQRPDFRMNPDSGPSFSEWLTAQSENDLAEVLENFGEEPRAKKLAKALKTWGPDKFVSSKILAENIERCLAYPSPSRTHPATRSFQAFRMAINDELRVLKSLLEWAPAHLHSGGRFAVISFHSLEDRFVKNTFRRLALEPSFVILTKKPLIPGERELQENPRSRSAKLRVLEKV